MRPKILSQYGVGEAYGVNVTDLNSDGKPDLLVAEEDDNILWIEF